MGNLKVRVLLALFFVWSWAFSQSDIQLKIKSLESKGLPYFYNNDIEQTVKDWLKNENQSTSIFLGRLQHFQPMIEKALQEKQLPWFLAYLPAGTTGFEPRFRDEGGSSGMWPLGFTMGKKYGLRETALFDERRDPDKSTIAALAYLNDLNFIYRDWLKSITAFRVGAIRMNQIIHELNGDLDFDRIYQLLEPEERITVIQFYSALVVLHYATEFGIRPVPYLEDSWVAVKSINQPVTFGVLTEHLGVGISELRMMNPELRADVIPYMGKQFEFKIPASFGERYEQIRDSLPMWLVEKRGGGYVNQVIMPTVRKEPVADHSRDTAVNMEIASNDQSVVEQDGVTPPKPKNLQQKVWVYYKVKSGDAVFTLSDVFDCTPEQLRSWNHMHNNVLKVGMSLKFYVPAAQKGFYTKINAMSISQKRTLAGKD